MHTEPTDQGISWLRVTENEINILNIATGSFTKFQSINEQLCYILYQLTTACNCMFYNNLQCFVFNTFQAIFWIMINQNSIWSHDYLDHLMNVMYGMLKTFICWYLYKTAINESYVNWIPVRLNDVSWIIAGIFKIVFPLQTSKIKW